MVLISTHMSEIGEEQFSGNFLKEEVTDLAYSPELKHAVVAGSACIKVCTAWWCDATVHWSDCLKILWVG